MGHFSLGHSDRSFLLAKSRLRHQNPTIARLHLSFPIPFSASSLLSLSLCLIFPWLCLTDVFPQLLSDVDLIELVSGSPRPHLIAKGRRGSRAEARQQKHSLASAYGQISMT